MNPEATAAPGISACLPVLDEEANVRPAYEALRDVLRDVSPGRYEIIFVDDGSCDGTPGVLEELSAQNGDLRWLRNPGRHGIGACVRHGWSAARFDTLLYLDADEPVDGQAVGALLAALRNAPIAIGVRDVRGHNLWRRGLSHLYSFGARLFFGIVSRDVNFGVKGIWRSALARMPLQGDTAFFNVELLAWARRLEIPVLELPMHYTFRKRGVSKGVRFLGVLVLLKEAARFHFDRRRRGDAGRG